MNEYLIDDYLTLRQEKNCTEGLEAGAYLIHNLTQKKYYVGQSTAPADRVFTHFTGRGNGDVYADYKKGDGFTVRFYPLEGSSFRDLNELEYHLIRIYESNVNGYNRRGGNRTQKVLYTFSDYQKGRQTHMSSSNAEKQAHTIVKRNYISSGVLVRDVPFVHTPNHDHGNYMLPGNIYERVSQLVRDALRNELSSIDYSE